MQKLEILTDEELVKLHADGDVAASGVLLCRYKNAVKAICRQFFLVGGDEEDLMQEGMIALFGCISEYDPKFGAFGPYASRCVKNRVIDAVRKSGRNKNKPLADFVDVQSISDGELLSSSDTNPETLYLSAEGEKLILKSIDEKFVRRRKKLVFAVSGRVELFGNRGQNRTFRQTSGQPPSKNQKEAEGRHPNQ